jgi:hypothetical protein
MMEAPLQLKIEEMSISMATKDCSPIRMGIVFSNNLKEAIQ